MKDIATALSRVAVPPEAHLAKNDEELIQELYAFPGMAALNISG
jgi:hypothetical protein